MNQSPRDCSLLVGLPPDRSTFLSRLESHGDESHAALIMRLNPGLGAEGAWRTFEPLLEYANHVCDEVSAVGVHVERVATLATVREACRRTRVITLFTHLATVPILPAEIVHPDRALQSLGRPESSLQRAIRARLDANAELTARWARIEHLPRPSTSDLAKILNGVVEMGGSPNVADAVHCTPLGRIDIEAALGGALIEARCIEFADGMATGSRTAACVPTEWAGVFDLSLCSSNQLGRLIKSRCRKATCIVNASTASMLARLMRYKLIVRSLAATAEQFADAVVRVHQEIGDDSSWRRS